MTIPLNDLLVNLKWNEEGAEIPARVRAQLTQLAAAQAALARQAGLGAAPGVGPGSPLRAGAGRSPFQAEWASSSQILQAMQRDAAKARGAVDDLRGGLEAVPPAAAGSSRAIGTLRMAAAGATFQILGMSGEVGRLLSGLLMFSTGSTVTLLAVAALGSLGLAFRAATADARMNREANEQLVVSLKALGAHATITGSRIEIARLEAQLRDPTLGQRIGAAWSWFRGPAFGGVATITDWQEGIKREIAALRGGMGAAGEDFTQPGREALRSANLSLEVAKLRQQLTGASFTTGAPVTALDITQRTRALELAQDPKIGPAMAAQIAARERETAAINASTEAQERARIALEEAAIRLQMVGQPQAAVTEALRVRALERVGEQPSTAADIARRERDAARTGDRADLQRTLRSPEFALSTLQTLTQGIRQGGAGAIGALGSLSLGAAGMRGIAGTAAAGPLGWVGFGLSAVSTLIGAFSNAEEKRTKKIVDAINRQGKEIVEKGSRVFIVDGRTGSVEELRQADDHDAATRVRGYAGLTG